MSKLGVVVELTNADLTVLVRRFKKARAVEGGLGPTEDHLLYRFEMMLPASLRPPAPPPDHDLSIWDV